MLRYRFIRVFMYLATLILLVRIRLIGGENIPKKGPFVVALNHMSTTDTPILLLAFPVRPWRFFAGEKWQNHPIYGPIMAWLGAIYINRGEADRAALKRALAALQDDIMFGLAPEGSRSKEGVLSQAKDGAAYLASKANVPVLPVGIVNTDVLFANFKRLRLTRVEVRVGRPFMLPDLGRRVRSADLSAYTELIMARIAALLPPRYHGYYADSPALAAILAGEDPWQTLVEQVES